MTGIPRRDGVESLTTQSSPRDVGASGGLAQEEGTLMDETQTTASTRPKWWNDEHLRILKAAERGALQLDDSGRWVITDEKKRPAPAERRHLSHGWRDWPPAFTSWLVAARPAVLTADGRELLRELPAMIERGRNAGLS